jgi:hypothetical protein
MRAGSVLKVIFNTAWEIALEDREFGPYPTREVTFEMARTWAEAEKKGHCLDMATRDGIPRYELFLQ